MKVSPQRMIRIGRIAFLPCIGILAHHEHLAEHGQLGVVLPRFGSVRFKGHFPRTLNRTIGPVQGNPRTRT
jgi:hypothetical protein